MLNCPLRLGSIGHKEYMYTVYLPEDKLHVGGLPRRSRHEVFVNRDKYGLENLPLYSYSIVFFGRNFEKEFF